MADTVTQLYARLRPLIQRDIQPGGNITIVQSKPPPAGGGGGGSGISDHGSLTGLSDDDHLQYLTNARGDARYLQASRRVIAGAGLVSSGGGGASEDTLTSDVTHNIVGTDGILVSADGVALNPLVAGAGLDFTAGVLSIASGNTGIAVSADALALTLASGAGLEIVDGLKMGTPTDLSVASTVSSVSGVTHTHKVTSSSNATNATLLATDSSGYLTLVKLVATQRVTTPLIDSTAGADIVLSPASNLVKLPASKMLQSDNYASQATGMRVTYDGEGDFRYLFTDELHAKSFIADLEQALAGGQIICKSVATLSRDFTAPAASAATTIYLNDLPSAENMAVFQAGDIIRLRTFSRSGGSLVIADCWGAVTAYANLAGKEQSWTFTRSITARAGAMPAGTIVYADSIVLDYGKTGNGFYEVNAIDGAYAANSPYAQVVTWSTHPENGQTVRARLGNLRGLFGVADEYGLYVGDGTAVTNSYLRMSNTLTRFNNVESHWYLGSTEIVQISAATGLQVNSQTGSYDKRRAYSFVSDAGGEVGGLYSYHGLGATETAYMGLFNNNNQANAAPAGNSQLDIRSSAQAGKAAWIHLRADELPGYDYADLTVGVAANIGYVGFTPQLWGPSNLADSALPAYSFDGETNKGMYNAGVGYLGFSTGGVQRLLLGSGGAAITGNMAATGAVIPGNAGAYIDQYGPINMTSGWRRIGVFSGSQSRGHVHVTLYNAGGGSAPFVVEIDAFRSYGTGQSSLFVRDHRGSQVSAVRITNDGTSAYLEANFAVALDSLYYRREVVGWTSVGFTLNGTAVSGGGTVECSVSTSGGLSVASSGASTSYLPNARIETIYANSVQVDSGSWGSGYRFSGSNGWGMLSTNNYFILENDGAGLLQMRLDNADSFLRLGYGNTNNRNSYIDLFANGSAPTTYDSRLIRGLGVNGALTLENKGTGVLAIQQANLGVIAFNQNGAEVMRIHTDQRVGIGTNAPAALLDVDGFARAGAFIVDGDSGSTASAGGLVSFTKTVSAGATVSAWTGFLRVYINGSTYRIPYVT